MSTISSEDLDRIEKEEGGRGLRARLESALAELNTANSERASLKADKVIQDHGLSLVKAEDLAGVELADLETKALALQAEKLEAQKDLARSVFAKKGLAGSELEQAVEDFLAPAAESGTPPVGGDLSSVRALGRISGQTPDPRAVTVPAGASAMDLLRAAEMQSASKQTR